MAFVSANKEHGRTSFRRTKNIVEPRFGEQRTLSNRVDNGARRGLVSANKEHGRTSFWRTKNIVEPHFGEQRTLSNRIEYNGARRGLVSANKEHGRTSFWSTRPRLSTSCSLSALFGDAVRASIHDPDTNLPRLLQPSTPSISRPWRPPSWNLPLLSTERPSGLITLTQTWFSANASSSSTRYPTRRSPQPHFLLLDYSATPFPSLDESRRWSTSGVLPRRHLHPVDERLSSAVSLFRNSAPSP